MTRLRILVLLGREYFGMSLKAVVRRSEERMVAWPRQVPIEFGKSGRI